MIESASEVVKRELVSWLGVTVHDHRFGGMEFRVNGREMGHMHGDELGGFAGLFSISFQIGICKRFEFR